MTSVYSKREINTAFRELSTEILANTKKGGTSCEDVLQYLFENPQKIWHMSWELIGQTTKNGKYLSHRAPARVSDLALHESLLVEDRKIGRFKAYRLRIENLTLIQKRLCTKEELPPERQEVVLQERCEHGLPTFVKCPNCK